MPRGKKMSKAEMTAKIKEIEDKRERREKLHVMSPLEAKLMRTCKARIEAIRMDKDRKAYVKQLPGWDEQYRSKYIESYYDGEADLFIPMTYETVEVISTYLMATIFLNDPPFKIQGFEDRDIKLAEDVWEPWFKYQTTKKFSLEEKMERIIMAICKYGTVAVKNGWKYKRKKVKQFKGYKKTKIKGTVIKKRVTERIRRIVADYPDMEVWPIERVYFDTQDPEGIDGEFDFVAYQGRSRLCDLELLDRINEADGIYKHTKWLRDPKYKMADRIYLQYMKTEGWETQPKQSHLQYVNWYECWLNYDLDNDGYAEEIVVVIANDKLVIRLEQNPYDEDFKPLLLCQFSPKDNSPYGMGIPEILYKMQIELNDTANQTMDNATFLLNNMWIIDVQAIDQAAAEVFCVSTQGGIIPVDPSQAGATGVDNVIKALEKPNIIEAGILKMKMVREWGRDATGTPTSLQGVPNRYKPSATEFAGTQTASIKRLQKVAKRIERRILKMWLRKALALNYQYVGRLELLKVLGKRAVIYKKKKKADLMMDCDFVPVGSLELEDRAGKVQTLLYYLKTIQGFPPQVSRVNIPVLLRMIWRAMGDEYKYVEDEVFFDDPAKELINPEDENRLIADGAKLAPHVFDDHAMHIMVHRGAEQSELMQKHIDLHEMIAQQLAQQMSSRGMGSQSMPQGGQRTSPGEKIGEMKTPPVL